MFINLAKDFQYWKGANMYYIEYYNLHNYKWNAASLFIVYRNSFANR